MGHRVKTLVEALSLPNGRFYPDANTTVTLTDDEFNDITSVTFTAGLLEDLGPTEEPGEGGSSTLGALFNVEDYGAVGDGVTDDYAAIKAAHDAMLASADKGILFFPRLAVYRVVATPARLSTLDSAYALFPYPLVSPEGPRKYVVGVQGVGDPYSVRSASSFGAEGDAKQVATATIIKIEYDTPFAWSETQGLPSVFGFSDTDITGHASDNIVSNLHFVADGIIIRQPPNPSLCGMNLEMVSTCRIKSIRFDVDAVLDAVPEPTHPTGASLLAPKSNNNVSVAVESFMAEGYYTGLPYSEHCDVTRAIVLRCKIAISNRRACSHVGKMGMLKLEQCPYQMAGYDPAGVGPNLGVIPWIGGTLVIDFVDVEHYAYEAREDNPAGVPWIYPPVNGCDIYAPDGGLSGSIRGYGRINSEPAPPTGIGIAPFGGGPDVYILGNTDAGLGISGFGIYNYAGEPVTQRHLGNEPTNPVVVDPPGVPTIGVATPGVQSVSVAFTPSGAGGAATSFTATSTPGSITATGASSPIVVTGLTEDVAYTFTVHATNSAASSAESAASNSATPTAPVALPSDDFNRADGPLTTTSSGHAYLGNADSSWSVVGNKARHAYSGTAWINAIWVAGSAGDFAVQATLVHVTSLEAGLIARVTDAANFLYMDIIFSSSTTASVELYKRVGGSFSGNAISVGGPIVVSGLTEGQPVTLRLECAGTAITAKVNGVTANTAVDSSQTGTGYGFVYGAEGIADIDNFLIAAL